MIKYKELRWSNCFSYGVGNVIRFDLDNITQLVGKNGHGKSSIGLILEEVLFNKNSKGIKKGSVLNRYGGAKSYSIELDFEKDGVEYRIETSRGATQKVSLYRNGEDISSHTATNTFKDIEGLIGYDHKTFSQIVYQSSTQSLEFLTATDTQRKKFLIDLLKLTKYANALEIIKAEHSIVSKALAVIEGKAQQAEAWLKKFSQEDLAQQEMLPVPEYPEYLELEIRQLQSDISNIDSENKRRVKNQQQLHLLNNLEKVPVPIERVSSDAVDELKAEIAVLKSKISTCRKEIANLRATKDRCPTCGASLGVDRSHLEAKIELEDLNILEHTRRLGICEGSLSEALKVLAQHTKYTKFISDRESLSRLYDPSVPSELLDAKTSAASLIALKDQLASTKSTIDKITADNAKRAAHNTKVGLLLGQQQDIAQELSGYYTEVYRLSKRVNNLSILSKAFSNTGLVAYKIECLVKDLEILTNEYLADMSDGRFQLGFEISNSDKLNVVITDNGTDIEIAALSNGERARVNISTLLAIRKLMQSLSNTRSNLLILDETIESLDAEGKDKLIEVLLKEHDVNTFLVSHGFSHPLLEKLRVVKTDNISRIEV